MNVIDVMPAGGQAWIVTDDALARQVLADPRFAMDPGALARPRSSLGPPLSEAGSLNTMDGAEHRRMRSVHAPAFTRRRVLAGRDRMVTIARDLFTELAEESARTGRPADLVAQFVRRYPLTVICDLLGIPLADPAMVAELSDAMVHGDAEQARAGFTDLGALVADAVRASHEGSAGTLTALLVERAHAEFGDVSDDEILHMITALVFGGQVTTESLLGHLMAYQLAGHFDTANAPDDGAVDAFVMEVLRLHPPSPFTLWRFTTTELDLAGVTLPAGAPVLVDIEGINTDPSRQHASCVFDPNRPRLPDLTFGDGPHVCIGAQLAMLEGRVVATVLCEEFPDACLAVPFAELERDPEPSRTPSRRLVSLPVRLRGGDTS